MLDLRGIQGAATRRAGAPEARVPWEAAAEPQSHGGAELEPTCLERPVVLAGAPGTLYAGRGLRCAGGPQDGDLPADLEPEALGLEP